VKRHRDRKQTSSSAVSLAMAWVLVTPASRGIGAAIAQHLLKTIPATVPIVATARKDIPGTKERLLSGLDLSEKQSDRLDVQPCDVLSEQSIRTLAEYCQDRYEYHGEPIKKIEDAHLRAAFMVPGRLTPEKAPKKIDHDDALETLKLNLLAPMMLAKHFSSKLASKKMKLRSIDGLPSMSVMAFMSARVGSITDNGLGGWYSYRSSKAGLNQFAKTLDLHLKLSAGENAMCVTLHPGTVKTDLSAEFWSSTPEEKLFSPEFSAARLVDVVKNLEDKQRGKCWDWQGKMIPP
jgi:NAD(P)-dependent dehydrogenase (short-subunit alcohol dehydrogenase family)